jgi:hypothetical protein
MADSSTTDAPVFKKRPKSTFKRKHDSSSGDEDSGSTSPHLSVAEILRQRRQGKVRRSAIEAFVSEQYDEQSTVALNASSKEESDIDKMKNRFVVETGQVVGLYDKQM